MANKTWAIIITIKENKNADLKEGVCMLCEKCKKNAATIYFQQIINGEKREFHLCSECAAKMQGIIPFDTTFDNMFKGFLEGFMDMGNVGYSQQKALVCPSCKMTFDEFRETGRVGCSDCYNAFKKQFASVLKNIHGSIRHLGKIPKKAGSELSAKREIENLRDELKRAVKNEEYEQAARLRDKIRSLEGGVNNG